MTRKLFIFIFSFGIYANSVYAQNSSAYESRWQARFLVGTNIPITRLLQGAETDYFLRYGDNSLYWQIFSISYFFHERWGVEFNYQPMTSRRIGRKADEFMASMQSMYGDRYYVSPDISTMMFNRFDILDGDFARFFLGLVHRFETDKFYVYPKLAFGVSWFDTDIGRVHLKEKNSNLEHRIVYSAGDRARTNNHLIFAPSVSFGYKLSRRFYLNADIMFSFFRTEDILFEKATTNLYTGERQIVERFNYRRNISALSLGAGLIFVIN